MGHNDNGTVTGKGVTFSNNLIAPFETGGGGDEFTTLKNVAN